MIEQGRDAVSAGGCQVMSSSHYSSELLLTWQSFQPDIIPISKYRLHLGQEKVYGALVRRERGEEALLNLPLDSGPRPAGGERFTGRRMGPGAIRRPRCWPCCCSIPCTCDRRPLQGAHGRSGMSGGAGWRSGEASPPCLTAIGLLEPGPPPSLAPQNCAPGPPPGGGKDPGPVQCPVES